MQKPIPPSSAIVPYQQQGAGIFKKPKASKPTVVAESGRSVSQGQIIEILASGGNYGIEGLGANPKENIYLDDTPIIASGIENFKGIEIIERRGLPYQVPIAEFNSEISNEVSVGVEVKNGNPVTRTFVNDNCAAIRLRLSFILNENQKDSSGNVTGTKGASINFRVLIKQGVSGNFVEFGNITVSGKYSDSYERTWYFNVNSSFDEYSIRLERVTGVDSSDFRRVIRWESYSVIIDSILTFKRLAYVGLKFNAEDFGQSIPERKYKIKGNILLIPTNSTINLGDRGLDYVGNWDGNFKIATMMTRSFLPIIWFLMTDPIDGCGISAQNIDRWSLYEVDKNNNEFVKNGSGGTERRYLFDLIFNRQNTSPYDLVNWLCSGCNCRMIEEFGQIRFIQDSPSPIYATLTNADVDKGEFIYSTVDVSEIATQVQVSWVDQSTGKPRQEFINDPANIAKYGKQSKQVEAVGCSRRTQAIRIGRSILFSESNEIETVTFKARDFVAFIPIGKVIAIQDANINGMVFGGIVDQSTVSTINFQNAINLPTYNTSLFNEEYYLTLYPDIREGVRTGNIESGLKHYQVFGQTEGRSPNGYLLHIVDADLKSYVRRITNTIPGTYTTLTFTPALPFTPAAGTSFMVQVPAIPLNKYKIEAKDYSGDDLVTVTCKQFIDTKWDYIENQYSVEPASVSQPIAIFRPSAPTDLKVQYFFTATNNINIDLSWAIPLNQDGSADYYITKYYVYWRVDAGSWVISECTANNYTIATGLMGLFEFKVLAENINNQISNESATITQLITDIQAMADVSVANNSGMLVF